jgi:hypothetical protein
MKKNKQDTNYLIHMLLFFIFMGIEIYFSWNLKPIEGVFHIIHQGIGIYFLIFIFATSLRNYKSEKRMKYLLLMIVSFVFTIWGTLNTINSIIK